MPNDTAESPDDNDAEEWSEGKHSRIKQREEAARVKRRDDHTCQRCLYEGSEDPGENERLIQVYELDWMPTDIDEDEHPDDGLITVCRPCHGVLRPDDPQFDRLRDEAPLLPADDAHPALAVTRYPISDDEEETRIGWRREQTFSRDNYTCQRCSEHKDEEDLVSYALRYHKVDSGVADVRDKLTVCRPCLAVMDVPAAEDRDINADVKASSAPVLPKLSAHPDVAVLNTETDRDVEEDTMKQFIKRYVPQRDDRTCQRCFNDVTEDGEDGRDYLVWQLAESDHYESPTVGPHTLRYTTLCKPCQHVVDDRIEPSDQVKDAPVDPHPDAPDQLAVERTAVHATELRQREIRPEVIDPNGRCDRCYKSSPNGPFIAYPLFGSEDAVTEPIDQHYAQLCPHCAGLVFENDDTVTASDVHTAEGVLVADLVELADDAPHRRSLFAYTADEKLHASREPDTPRQRIFQATPLNYPYKAWRWTGLPLLTSGFAVALYYRSQFLPSQVLPDILQSTIAPLTYWERVGGLVLISLFVAWLLYRGTSLGMDLIFEHMGDDPDSDVIEKIQRDLKYIAPVLVLYALGIAGHLLAVRMGVL